jgi:hypothetical protein
MPTLRQESGNLTERTSTPPPRARTKAGKG